MDPDRDVAHTLWRIGLQKVILSASCRSRGGAAFTTRPKRLLLTSPLTATGPKNWVWLKVLKVSSRNCSAFASDRWTSLTSARSVLTIPGPWNDRREALPGVPRALGVNNEVLKYGWPF